MIKINHSNIQSIVQLHFEACEKFITPRLDFYIDLFNSLGYKKHQKKGISPSKRYNLPDVTILSIINPFLKSKYRYKNRRRNVTILQVISTLTTSNNSIIRYQNSIQKFKIYHDFFKLVKVNLNTIVTGKPNDLNNLIKSNSYNVQSKSEIKKGLEKIFAYETFIGTGFELNNKNKWNNYSLTDNLGLSVCPYCNRNWINTVMDNNDDSNTAKITSPQLDHFLPKSEHPLFRLSFYNLIPSCETCNSRLKKDKKFTIDKNLHPYIDGYGNNATFKVAPQSLGAALGFSNDYKIELDTTACNPDLKKRINKHNEIFKIEEIYKEHGDIITDIYQKKYYYGDKYLDMLTKQYSGLSTEKSELYRLAFGNYFYEEDFKKRPFSKLIKDVTKQLGLL